MPEGLKIQVGADVQQAVKALSQDIPKAADITANSVQKIGKGFQYAGLESQHMAQKLKSSFQSVSNAAKASSRSINIFEGSIEDLEARIGARKSLIRTETDVNNISKLNKEISLLELRVSDLSNTGRVKFNQFGAAITNTAQSAKIANAQINITGLSLSNVGGAAQKAFAGLLRISYLLPGLGFAGLIGIIGGVAGALLGIGTSAKQTAVDFGPLAAKLKETVDREKEFKDAIDKASASVVGQASGLSDLRNILINVNSEFRGLTQNIIDQALTQVLFDKKNVEVQRLLTAEVQKRFKLLKQQNPFSDTKTFTDKTFSTDPLEREIDDASQSIDLINNKARLLGLTFDDVFNNKSRTEKVKDFSSAIIAEAKRINAAFGSGINLKLNFGFFDSIKEQVDKASQYLKDFRGGNFKFVFPVEIDLKAPEQIKPVATEFGAMFYSELKTYFDRTEPTDFSLLKALRPVILTDAEQLGEDTALAIANGFRNIQITAFESIGQSIGELLSGGDIGDAFKSFASLLADGVTAIGKQLIAIGVAAALANEALKKLFAGPGGAALAIAGGIALIAAGAALKSALSGGIKGFAGGGYTGDGARNEIAGVVHKGEYVLSQEMLRNLGGGRSGESSASLGGLLSGMGGGSQVVVMRTIVRGNNLALVQARTSRSQKRTTGR